jgi:hypothetical protein
MTRLLGFGSRPTTNDCFLKGVQFFLCLAARGGNGNPEEQFQVSGFQFWF